MTSKQSTLDRNRQESENLRPANHTIPLTFVACSITVTGAIIAGVCLLAIPSSQGNPIQGDGTDLRLLFLLWRHGDRAPLITYPTDPHKNHTYNNSGMGNLIGVGKRREYELGKYLRERYGEFLGEEMTPGKMVLRSTATTRARQSAALVAAGLFPPAPSQTWGSGLGQLWQPALVDYVPSAQDSLLWHLDVGCSAVNDDLEVGFSALPEESRAVTENGKLFEYLEQSTGRPIKGWNDAFYITDLLVVQESAGLVLPEWTKKVYPTQLMQADRFVSYLVYTERAKRAAAGRFLSELVSASRAWRRGELPADRQLYAFSAHDLTLLAVMAASDIPRSGRQPYGSVMMIELREERATGQLGLKFLLHNDTQAWRAPAHVLRVAGCAEFCPLDEYEALVGHRMLADDRQWREACAAPA